MSVTSSKSNHYYPYGLPMPNYSSDYQGNDYKYGGKEFDMFQKMNIYDFGSRTYVPDECRFWQPDPLADVCHGISPYAFCAGDPVNNIDPDGQVWISRTKYGIAEYYYDRQVQTIEDLRIKYPNDPSVQIVEEGLPYYLEGNTYIFNNENNGSATVNGNAHNTYDIIYGNRFTIFGTADNACNAATLHRNWFGTSYTGPQNPLGYDKTENYQYIPRNRSEMGSYRHDIAYDNANAKGTFDALFNCNASVISADWKLVKYNAVNIFLTDSSYDKCRSTLTAAVFYIIAQQKSQVYLIKKSPEIAKALYKIAKDKIEKMF